MKNSPHRAKHQVKKAIRQAQNTHPLPIKAPHERWEAQVAMNYNQRIPLNERLRALDPKKSLETLKAFKKHAERLKLMTKPHHSKRSTQGMIEGVSPHVYIQEYNAPHLHRNVALGMQKSKSVDRKVMKKQNRHNK